MKKPARKPTPAKLADEKIPAQNWEDKNAPINYGEADLEQEEPAIDDPAPELSPELLTLAAPQKEEQSEPEPEKPAKKTDVESCRDAAFGTMIAIIKTAELFGACLGVSNAAVDEWANDVAPAMAKHGLIPSAGGSKWAAELTAAKATAALGFGMYCGYKASKARDTQAAPAKQADKHGD